MVAKKNAPLNKSEKARIAGRKQSVKTGVAKGLSPYEARKRYYVQTRVAELEKAGKPVSAEKRKQLRQNFNSGNVSRKGFAAPKKKPKAIELPKTSPVVKPSVPSGGRYGRTENRPSSSSASTSSKKGRIGAGTYAANPRDYSVSINKLKKESGTLIKKRKPSVAGARYSRLR